MTEPGLRWFAALVLLLCAATAASADEKPPAPCKLLLAESLDIITEPIGLIAVAGKINGRAGNFIIDTGNIFGVVEDGVADQLGLPIRHAHDRLRAMGGITMNHYIESDFELGRLSGKALPFVLAPGSTLSSDTIGMIGPSILANYDVEIDFVKGKLNLFEPNTCDGPVSYWTHDPVAAVPMTMDRMGHIVLPVTLEGREVRAMLDTGAETSTLDIDSIHATLGIDADNPALKKLPDIRVNGDHPTAAYRYPFTSLTLEGIDVKHPDILILGKTGLDEGMPSMILGMGILRQLHIYIAYRSRKVYFTAAEAK